MALDAGIVADDFENWLCKKLTDLDIDHEVYGTYITGILKEEDETENKREALEGILASFLDDPNSLCDELMEKWQHPFSLNMEKKVAEKSVKDIIAEHSAKKMNEKITGSCEKNASASGDLAAKQALLAKYSEVFDEVDEDSTSKTSGKSTVPSVTSGLFKNLNTKAVSEAEKMKRDKQKEEAQKKKERDKMDREKQKLKKEERKEKEKKRTQKKEKSAR